MSLSVTSAVPTTVERLLSLKPRESFVYYRGNYEDDASDSTSRNYRRLLNEVFDTAARLERDRKVALTKVRCGVYSRPYGRHNIIEYKYIAIGR